MQVSTRTEHAIVKYYELLGGHQDEFPVETIERVMNFEKELQYKRDYNKFTTFRTGVDEMIIINGLKVFSFCEHHLLPFFGFCSIGYIPSDKILGISKFQRWVDKIASKPSLQETITHDIGFHLANRLGPKAIGVAMTCVHTCMFGRGINTSTCTVNTQYLSGPIKDKPEARQEFFSRIDIENILR